MGRKKFEMGGASTSTSTSGGRCSLPILLVVALATFSVVYMGLSIAMRRPLTALSAGTATTTSDSADVGRVDAEDGGDAEEARGDCCRGIENLELWGPAVKWGTDFKFNSSRECCRACKEMCRGVDGPCLCNSWVFCGDRERCGDKFGECWLKKQKDVMIPAIHDSGEKVIWTSGIIFGKGEGIVGLETEHGTLHIKLFPECAPHSVAYIIELLAFRHCAGCQFYRAESRGDSWDSEGNHINDASLGPPYGLIQGTLEADGIPFKDIAKEACPIIQRGSVAWIGSGPEFIISLANHEEWRRAYTVFGSVLPEDMVIAERISNLPTKPDVWSDVNVSVLDKPVSVKWKQIKKSDGDLNLNTDIKLDS